jgi:hypothetical protein
MNKTKKISDFTFVVVFISAITFSALLISTSDQKYIVYIENFYARFKYSRVVIICILLSFPYHYLV